MSAVARADLAITGMTCASCVARVEKTLAQSPGVRRAGVNLATSRATVEYDPAQTAILNLVDAVKSAGYGARDTSGDGAIGDARAELAERGEFETLKRKLLVAVALSLPVLILAMSHGRISALSSTTTNWIELVLTISVPAGRRRH